MITRFSKQMVLNHTVKFDQPPSGLAVTKAISKFIAEEDAENFRPLAVHIFVIDTVSRRLFEITSAGIIFYNFVFFLV